MSNVKQWLITMSHDQSISELATRLSAEGLTIKNVLEEVGCITGSADDATVGRLRKIKGVVDISPDMQIDVGPPDSEETW